MCGKLFCRNGQENPNYGRMVRFSDCKAAFFDDYTKDYGQVETGTKCGNGKVTGGACEAASHLFEGCSTERVSKPSTCLIVSSFLRCAARASVWIFRQLTETQTAQRNARSMR